MTRILVILGGLAALVFFVLPKRAAARVAVTAYDTAFKRSSTFPDWARAVARVESDFDPNAVGTAGEFGMMQIKLGSAQEVGFSGDPRNLFDAATNIFYGSRYLDKQLFRFGFPGGIHAYNVGPGAYSSGGRNWDYYNRVSRAREELGPV